MTSAAVLGQAAYLTGLLERPGALEVEDLPRLFSSWLDPL
jgi:hypothetical protein